MVSRVIAYDRVHCILFENIIKSLVHDSRVARQCYSACCFPLLLVTRTAWRWWKKHLELGTIFRTGYLILCGQLLLSIFTVMCMSNFRKAFVGLVLDRWNRLIYLKKKQCFSRWQRDYWNAEQRLFFPFLSTGCFSDAAKCMLNMCCLLSNARVDQCFPLVHACGKQ